MIKKYLEDLLVPFSTFAGLVVLWLATSHAGITYTQFNEVLLPATIVVLLCEKKYTSITTFILWIVFEAIFVRHLNIFYIITADAAWLLTLLAVIYVRNKFDNYYVGVIAITVFSIFVRSLAWNVYGVVSLTFPQSFSYYVTQGWTFDLIQSVFSSLWVSLIYFASKKSFSNNLESKYHRFR